MDSNAGFQPLPRFNQICDQQRKLLLLTNHQDSLQAIFIILKLKKILIIPIATFYLQSKMNSCIQVFNSFVDEVQEKAILEKAIEETNEKYPLKAYDIASITYQEAKTIFDNIQKKFYKKQTNHNGMNWFQNQLRIFVWILVCYAYLKKIEINEIAEENWQFFSTIFSTKNPKLFDYQCHSIYLSPHKNQLWVKDEDNHLKNIITEKKGKIKWNEISKQLFEISDKAYFRTPKQCRERWNNHLDPKKVKGSWKIPECLKMFQFVYEKGRKWAKLVKVLENTRDEHSIKNKFNSLYRKQEKMTPGLEEKEIYEQIIVRLKTAMSKRELNKNGQISYDINDIEDEGYPEISREFQQNRFIFPKNDQPASSNYGEILRKKLMNFSSGPPKKSIATQACIGKNNINLKKKEKKSMKECLEEQASDKEQFPDNQNEESIDLHEYSEEQNQSIELEQEKIDKQQDE